MVSNEFGETDSDTVKNRETQVGIFSQSDLFIARTPPLVAGCNRTRGGFLAKIPRISVKIPRFWPKCNKTRGGGSCYK